MLMMLNLYGWMKTTMFLSQNSGAKRKKVGAIIVKDGHMVGYGWNQIMYPDIFGEDCEHEHGEELTTKEELIHAEFMAINMALKNPIIKDSSLMDSNIFISLSPCIECSKLICISGIKKVFYSNEYRKTDGIDYLKKVLGSGNVVQIKIDPKEVFTYDVSSLI